jgi:hypothetical protein
VFVFKRIETGHHWFEPEAFDQFCRRSVFSYVGFLNDHFKHHNVAVASIFPPTLSDEAWREGYVNAHIAATEGEPSAQLASTDPLKAERVANQISGTPPRRRESTGRVRRR